MKSSSSSFFASLGKTLPRKVTQHNVLKNERYYGLTLTVRESCRIRVSVKLRIMRKVDVHMGKRVQEPAYKIIDINEANIDEYDVCCFKSKKNTEAYRNKVRWVRDRFKDGLRFKLLLINEGPKRGFRSRGFIEYIPGEHTWRGIDAKRYMVIHCIWVIGQNKGHGYGTKLLEQCLSDAKGMNGVAVVTSDAGWLPRRDLFVKHEFEKVDASPFHLELYAKRLSSNVAFPKFNPITKGRPEEYSSGITIFKTDQCPYTTDSVKDITEFAKHRNLPLQVRRVENCREAQNGVHPYGTYCVLVNGKVLTYRPIGKRKLLEYLPKE